MNFSSTHLHAGCHGDRHDGQGKTGSVQRWGHCHHHHHHGAGDEGAARRSICRPETAVSGLSELFAQLCLCRHLLEQPPPHAACGQPGFGEHALGQPSLSVLAFAFSVHHRLDGAEPLFSGPCGAVRAGAVHGSLRLPDSSADHRGGTRSPVPTEGGARQRLEGQALACFLPRWGRFNVLGPRVALAFYVAVALLWLVPDRRIEEELAHPPRGGAQRSSDTPTALPPAANPPPSPPP